MKKVFTEQPASQTDLVSFSSPSRLFISDMIGMNGGRMAKGAVIAQYIRCSKPSCRCAEGRLHGPYWYLFWREEGRLKKAYVRRGEVEAVRAACEEWRSLQAYLLMNRRQTMGIFRQARQMLRNMKADRER